MKASFNIIHKDGSKPTFIPYKGWQILNDEGTIVNDPFTSGEEGPLNVVYEYPTHSHGHTLYNILNTQGEKILPKGVRHITYHTEGFYFIEDNNEDELIARGDVRGGFRACDYIEQYNIVFENGNILSNEWFDKIIVLDTQHIVAKKGDSSFLIDNLGKVLLELNIAECHWTDTGAYYTEGEKLYKCTNQGKEWIKTLSPLCKPGTYYVGHQEIEISESGEIRQNDTSCDLIRCSSSPLKKRIRDWSVIQDSVHPGSMFFLSNIITKDGYLLFNCMYSNVLFSAHTCSTGLFYVKACDKWELINAEERPILNQKFDDVNIIGQYAVVRIGESFSLIDAFGKILATDYTSVLWADKGIWGMNYLTKDEKKHFFHGEGGEGISYAQAVLTSGNGIILMENNNEWHLIKSDGTSIHCFNQACK